MTVKKKVILFFGWYLLGMALGILLFFLLSEFREGITGYLTDISDSLTDLEIRYTMLFLLSFEKYIGAGILLFIFGYLPFRKVWYTLYLLFHGLRHGLLCSGFLSVYGIAGLAIHGSLFFPQAIFFIPACLWLMKKGTSGADCLWGKHPDGKLLFQSVLICLLLLLCVFCETLINPILVLGAFTDFPPL